MINLVATSPADLGSGRIVLSTPLVAPPVSNYGQAVRVTLQLAPGGDNSSGAAIPYTCLCTLSSRSCQAADLTAAQGAESSAAAAAASAAVDVSVECAPAPARAQQRQQQQQPGARRAPPLPPPLAFARALDALEAAAAGSGKGAPVEATLRLLPTAPTVAKRVTVVADRSTIDGGWLAERLQQRLIERGCVVHFSRARRCLVLSIEPAGGQQGAVYRVARSTEIVAVAPEDEVPLAAAPAAAAVEPTGARPQRQQQQQQRATPPQRARTQAAPPRPEQRARQQPARQQQRRPPSSSSSDGSDSGGAGIPSAASAFDALAALGDGE